MKKLLIAAVSLILVFAFIYAVYLYGNRKFSRPLYTGSEAREVIVDIPSGATGHMIGNILRQKDLIGSASDFTMYLKFKRFFGDAPVPKAGTYRLSAAMSVSKMAEIMADGKTAVRKVTVPEGLTIWETASVISAATGIDSAQFVKTALSKKVMKDFGVKAGNLEGYLYPTTYFFPWKSTVFKTIEIMTSELFRALSREGIRAPVKIRGKIYSLHEILTLASIIEKEAAVPYERGKISGVFHNRLERGMRLGADPTVRYAVRRFKKPIRKSDLNSVSPYNTRKFRGLPPGPVCSPGIESIKAALYPEETRSLYFTAKFDGSGEHHFTESFLKHNKKTIESRRLLR